ncbi:MAG TPA: NUDIX domain-containing protein [Candidatus Pristimantibacillus sp.]|jgi:NADH pyrophosphatase NudC (nudix superfamily)|nr:NUDIX domain-containing protein [Candidatus Pristimantibacillus sp.]
MQDPTLFFHYCPKLIVFSEDKQSILMARRAGEADYDGVYTFIGGKTETTDGTLLAGLQREKNEEIGTEAKLKICYMMSCYQVWYTKKNGNSMVLPHHIAIYQGGEIKLNPGEYDDYKWVPLDEIEQHAGIPENPPAVRAALRYLPILTDDDFVEI